MTDLSIIFQNVSFAYDRATDLLIRDLSVHFTRGWTGIAGANGVGKSTILKLATGIANRPHLIVMDEPTNHFDLPSIECLEQALFDCPCGLFFVSHDRRFLDILARKRWHISKDKRTKGKFILEMK